MEKSPCGMESASILNLLPTDPIDLHSHSTASDGALSPADLVHRAAAHGCKMLALTDHDGVSGLGAAREAAEAVGIQLINGVEISVTWRKRSIHIVGLAIDPSHAPLLAGLHDIREGRVERARRMSDSLAHVGIEGAFEGAMTHCRNAEMIGRTHFARFLVEAGVCKDVPTVFKKYLTEGKPGYVKHEWTTLGDAVSWIVGAGGVAVIAHPGRYPIGTQLTQDLVLEFMEAGGQAIEVVSGSHDADMTKKIARVARRFELEVSAGSDFHAPGEGGRDVGKTAPLPEGCQPVWARWGADNLSQPV